MQPSTNPEVKNSTAIAGQQSTLIQISAAIILAVALIYSVGFAPMAVAHNAAHDTRHAVAFPCH